MNKDKILELLERRLSEIAYAEDVNQKLFEHEYIAEQLLQVFKKVNTNNTIKMDNIFQANLQSALARNDSTCYNLTADLYEQFLNLFGGYIEETKKEEERAD